MHGRKLLRMAGGQPGLRSIVLVLNMLPATAAGCSEVGFLELRPTEAHLYSLSLLSRSLPTTGLRAQSIAAYLASLHIGRISALAVCCVTMLQRPLHLLCFWAGFNRPVGA